MALAASSHRHRMWASANECNLKQCTVYFFQGEFTEDFPCMLRFLIEIVIDLMWPVTWMKLKAFVVGGGGCSCRGVILENSYTVSRKGERGNPLILYVDTNISPPPLSPQQWMSRGVWLLSILRTTGKFQENPRDPFRTGDWALCPAFIWPSGGLKGNGEHAAGGWSTWRHRVPVCVYILLLRGIFLCKDTGGDSKDCSSHHLWWPLR